MKQLWAVQIFVDILYTRINMYEYELCWSGEELQQNIINW